MDKRNTAQKNIIFNRLMSADHPTATELYESIHADYPKISRATVFRVLSGFAEAGKVKRLELVGSDTRFDARMQPHAHCYCLKCGKVTDVFDERFATVLATTEVSGFSVASAELDFNGLCEECKNGRG